MSIETLGESLLSQAKSKRKKQEKKSKILAGLTLGVGIGNIILRKKAQDKFNKFMNSRMGIIDNKTKQFQMGVNFWADHNNMMKTYGMGTTDTDWKNAFKQKQYDIYKERELGKTKLSQLNVDTLKVFEETVNPLIQDDLKAYEEKLNLFKDFKNIKGTEADKKLYLQNVTNKLGEASKIVSKDATIGSYLLDKLGLRERGLEEITVGEQTIVLPKRMDATSKQNLVNNIKLNNITFDHLDIINKSVTYTPFTDKQLALFVNPETINSKFDSDLTSLMTKILDREESRKINLGQQEFNPSFGNKKTIREIHKKITEKNKEAGDSFITDVLTMAMEERKLYELNPENKGKPKLPEYFIREAFKKYIPLKLPTEEDKKNLENQNKILFMQTKFPFVEDDGTERLVTPAQLNQELFGANRSNYPLEALTEIYDQLKIQLENNPYPNQVEDFLKNIENQINLLLMEQ